MKNINRESGDFHVIHEGPRPQEHGNSHLLSMADFAVAPKAAELDTRPWRLRDPSRVIRLCAVHGLLALIRMSSSSLSSCVTTKTSWTIVPLRATTLKPPFTGVETRNCNPLLRPRTLAITPGVIV